MSRNQREGKFDGKVFGHFSRLSPEKQKSLKELLEFMEALNMKAKQTYRHADDGPDERRG